MRILLALIVSTVSCLAAAVELPAPLAQGLRADSTATTQPTGSSTRDNPLEDARRQPGTRVITGIANTLMEDHFDVGAHFMHTIVTTADGEVFRVDAGLGRRFVGVPMSWLVQDANATDDAISAASNSVMQRFSDRWGAFQLLSCFRSPSVVSLRSWLSCLRLQHRARCSLKL